MKLYIDTSNSEKITIKLDEKEVMREATREKSQLLLQLIDEGLKRLDKTAREITGVEVNTGPGSFTGLRVGVSVANALGWALGIPVNGKDGLVEPEY